uniref:Uncharacterized protein n=1 Tax=Arundo donax TaxID=35708 RepID=A0A0A9FDG1_ARUDO
MCLKFRRTFLLLHTTSATYALISK